MEGANTEPLLTMTLDVRKKGSLCPVPEVSGHVEFLTGDLPPEECGCVMISL